MILLRAIFVIWWLKNGEEWSWSLPPPPLLFFLLLTTMWFIRQDLPFFHAQLHLVQGKMFPWTPHSHVWLADATGILNVRYYSWFHVDIFICNTTYFYIDICVFWFRSEVLWTKDIRGGMCYLQEGIWKWWSHGEWKDIHGVSRKCAANTISECEPQPGNRSLWSTTTITTSTTATTFSFLNTNTNIYWFSWGRLCVMGNYVSVLLVWGYQLKEIGIHVFMHIWTFNK